MRASLEGKIDKVSGRVAGLQIIAGIQATIFLLMLKLYFDLSQKQQTDSKPFGEFLSRVKQNFNSYFVASGTDDN
ncbi:unnamed protein product [Meloidogyne enterolobii]